MAASLKWKTMLSILFSGHNSVKNKHVIFSKWKVFGNMSMTRRNKNTSSQDTSTTAERDPFPIFADKTVQELLIRITGYDLLKIAGPQLKPLQAPVYKLLTDEELGKELEDAKECLKDRLQIPPYMNPAKPSSTPLAVDPDLADFDTASYVFTDISFGVKDRERSIVIRETDGALRVAPWDVKMRMNQIYSPQEGREYIIPKMFKEQNLERMISEKRYIYILDRACCQFEPDDPDFVTITHRVYSAVDTSRDYDCLRSTRHFGSLSFYLAWNRKIDFLLLDMINRDLACDAKDLISLYCIIHPESQTSLALKQVDQTDANQVIKAYMDTDAKEKAQLELALQALEDSRRTEGRKGSTS